MLLPLFLTDPRVPALARRSEPITVGIPLPRAAAATADAWQLMSADGVSMPFQVRPLDHWADGSIRWALLDFRASPGAGLARAVTLNLNGRGRAVAADVVSVTEAADALAIETAGTTFTLSRRAPLFFTSVHAGGTPLIEPMASALRVVSAAGTRCAVRWQAPIVEERGFLRVAVRINGEVRGRGVRLDLVARLHFHAGSPVVRLQLTVRNPRPAAHPEGFWELGDRGSVRLQELSVVLTRSWSTPLRRMSCSVDAGLPVREAKQRIEVYQDSSGGQNWRSTNHVNGEGVVPTRFRGYQANIDGDLTGGYRAVPVVVLEGGASLLLGAMFPAFWQNFPRAVEATPDAITLGLFPRQWADVHELQGGEQKTHDMYLLFGADPVTPLPLDWCRDRLIAHALPEWYASSEAVPYLTPAATDPNRDYLCLVNAAIEGGDTFVHKRERIDEYGWRHFGEIYGDHEAVFPVTTPSGGPLVSHYNNQYDPVAGFAYQFMRSGDVRWHRQAEELAAHVIDIDIYHTDRDKSAYNHGLFWHTVHYVDAGRATHRTYPNAKGSHGGGPGSEHNYTTGLMLRYLMTGDPAAREAAQGLAQFVIDMDDGGKTVFRWLDRGLTGLASASGSASYHGPGRGSANSLNALIDGHHLTGDRRFLDKADQIIRRCVHPRQDIEALNLLDAENRWFYTMFLQSLGKYLDYKIELGELDDRYAYARETLLHYARWMAKHEYAYLEKPDVLRYPTETWPAQDMRKSEVFKYAAKHAQGQDRDRFLERADAFFEYVTAALGAMPTRTLARPVVLLLSSGWMHGYFRQHRDVTAPPPSAAPGDWGHPTVFVPQKSRAIRRARILLVAGGLVAAGFVAWLLKGLL